MNCIVDIKKDGNKVLAYLPFDPRTEFHIPKGTICVKCVLENIQFKSKLMSRGSGKYCIFFSAPSATNKRPFHFVLTKDREKMVRIIGDNHYVKMLRSATACIIVCGDKVTQGIPEWLLADCSAATQNILLAIHSIGLGGVWCGVKQGSDFYKGIVKEFSLPNHIRPVSLIAFGYPVDEKIQSNRFEFGKIHFEFW
ncbi:nitroreductase family protein [Acetivibrio cellulolyticus]|uniref:nitroreductase family protein n=1 Tax=Acetivibrio cellulolyticus TaxID=35830 RepID=UPI0001E2F0E7|nr:nitroreductase family protein [Acetivibrio cellulolyticus]